MVSTVPHDSILESISDGVFTVDTDWRITSFNRAAERIIGVKKAWALGQFCFEVFKSNMCESACPLRRTMKSGKPLINRPGYCVTNTGQRIPISVSTALLTDENGTILGGAETFRDLSELEELKRVIEAHEKAPPFHSLSPSMAHIQAQLAAVAESSSSVVIQGETGTGKEVLARAIHMRSPWKDGPFVAVNCAAIPESLLESELFGYRKGAFTGAERDKPGRFALAEGGTLFLDEIGDLPLSLQVKLLRVLQDHVFEPLGSTKPVVSRFRLLCATNKDLAQMIEAETFRSDLYYRIQVIQLTLPPLRERLEDIPSLAHEFLERFSVRLNKPLEGFAPAIMACFYAYRWPGNIRELENVVERMAVLASGPLLGPELLPPEFSSLSRSIRPEAEGKIPQSSDLQAARSAAERECLYAALRAHAWHRTRTAAALGMNTSTLWRKMRRLGIKE